jgi:RNA polymerase sigma-70 factor (ECF subfamily)
MNPTSSAPAVRSGISALETYIPLLRRYFARRARLEDIDDLVQEVFLRIQSSLEPPVITYPERYLFRVASSVITDRVRRGAVRRDLLHESLEELHHPIEERTPERVILAQEALHCVVAAIEHLPRRTREVFVLHRFEQVTCSSIAAQLGLSVSAVEKHIMKALVALHTELKGS